MTAAGKGSGNDAPSGVVHDLDLDRLLFDERGLLPVVVQSVATGAVLMVAWADREAISKTLETGLGHFWSRSRSSLWQKGETSGHLLRVVEVLADCDRDTLLYRADPEGPTCHLGNQSCFDGEPARLELGWLAERRSSSAESSYTRRLLDEGVERIAQKVGEEAVEVVIAALGDRERVAAESADLLYHLLVLFESLDVDPELVARELVQRHRGEKR